MNIKIHSEDDLLDKFKKAIHILNNLRHYTKDWEENYGVESKMRKKRWEEKADKLLAELDPKHEESNRSINTLKV